MRKLWLVKRLMERIRPVQKVIQTSFSDTSSIDSLELANVGRVKDSAKFRDGAFEIGLSPFKEKPVGIVFVKIVSSDIGIFHSAPTFDQSLGSSFNEGDFGRCAML